MDISAETLKNAVYSWFWLGLIFHWGGLYIFAILAVARIVYRRLNRKYDVRSHEREIEDARALAILASVAPRANPANADPNSQLSTKS